MCRKGTPLTAEQIALLGTASDRKVGERLGITKTTAKYWRRKLGIDAWNHWTSEQMRLLGTIPDEEASQRSGKSVVAIASMRRRRDIPACNKRWTAEETKILLQATGPRAVIAAQLKRSVAAVNRRYFRVKNKKAA